MKAKILLTSVLLATISFSNAQSMGDITKATNTVNKTTAAVSATSFNVASISNQVMGILSPKLKLTEAQKPAVNSLVNEMLNKKKNLLPTMESNKAGYTSKMTANRESFVAKMKKNISPTQFTAFTALLPKSASAVTPLAQMLY